MGTHPIFESDFDCLTEMRGVGVRLSRRFLRYEQTKTHTGALSARGKILRQVYGQNTIKEKQVVEADYRLACIYATSGWILMQQMVYLKKYDDVAFLVKSGYQPEVIMYPEVPARELKWTPFCFNVL